MVNIISAYESILCMMMKMLGLKSQIIEVEEGTTLHFWLPKTNPTLNKKPSLLLLHGFLGDGILNWQFQVMALARDYSIYVPDFLFFGDSYTDKSERTTDFQARCLATVLRKVGVEKCIVVGFSYGGMVGFKLAELYPDLVESMVVNNSVMALTESITGDRLRSIGCNSWSEYLLPDSVDGLKKLLSIGFYKSPWLPEFMYQHLLEVMFDNRKEKAELLRALVTPDDAIIPKFPQGIHLLWGEGDKIFNMEIAQDLKKQLGDKVSIHWIEKAGHIALYDRPLEYNRCLKNILASLKNNEQHD